MKLDLKWKRKTGQYATGESLHLNKITLGGYSWNISRPYGSKADIWSGVILLPPLKNKEVVADTEEEIKGKIEALVTEWFEEALK